MSPLTQALDRLEEKANKADIGIFESNDVILKLIEMGRELLDAVEHTEKLCLCERFKRKGFDYGEKHPRAGKQVGKRWKSPRIRSAEALATANALFEEGE